VRQQSLYDWAEPQSFRACNLETFWTCQTPLSVSKPVVLEAAFMIHKRRLDVCCVQQHCNVQDCKGTLKLSMHTSDALNQPLLG